MGKKKSDKNELFKDEDEKKFELKEDLVEDEDLEIKPVAKSKRTKAKKKERKSGDDDQANEEDEVAESMEQLSLKKKKKKKSKDEEANEREENDNVQKESSQRMFMEADEPTRQNTNEFENKTEHLTATGILLSNARSKDIQIDKFSLAAYGNQLVKDTSLNILYGRRYGLVGNNGCGKSTLLKALAHREVPIQENVELYLLEREYEATGQTAVEAVLDIVIKEREQLEEEMDVLLSTVEGANSVRMEFVQERLQELDVKFAEQKARSVLAGLGFTAEMQDMKTKEFSGGWRMRVALARALFVKPTCLLLDDATNHLDLSAVVWLEEYLQTYPHTVVLVSHSQDFLNSVCTDILYLSNRQLSSFAGNYDSFVKVKAELDENARKRAKADQKKMQKIKENLAKQGKHAKQAKQAEKALKKRQEEDLTINNVDSGVQYERKLEFDFMECGGGLPSPFLKFNDVSFHYPNRPLLYQNLNFGLDLKSRVALVGPNGGGKSTLMKLMSGELDATSGSVERHHHLRIGRFHQHLTDQLDLSVSAVEWLCRQFSGFKPQDMRAIVGRFGLTGKSQIIPMEQLSDGQRRRVVFCWLAQRNCHLLMLDEPTNFLDPDTIDALAEAINNFDGGVVLISHDFRLIDQVAEEIWVVEDGTLEEWEGDIREYKNYLKEKVVVANNS